MQIQVGDLVEWIEPDMPYDVGIVVGWNYQGYPRIWWAGDEQFGTTDIDNYGEHLFVIGGSHECR